MCMLHVMAKSQKNLYPQLQILEWNPGYKDLTLTNPALPLQSTTGRRKKEKGL